LATAAGCFFLQQGAKYASAPLTRASLAAGLAKVGRSYQAASTYGTLITPRRHYGVSTVRDFAFDDKCECFRWVGPQIRID